MGVAPVGRATGRVAVYGLSARQLQYGRPKGPREHFPTVPTFFEGGLRGAEAPHVWDGRSTALVGNTRTLQTK